MSFKPAREDYSKICLHSAFSSKERLLLVIPAKSHPCLKKKLAEGVSHVPCLVCNDLFLSKITLLLCLIGIFKLRVFNGHLQLFYSIVTTYHCDG